MCASTYTLNFNSLLNIINATQLPDQLSLGIHRHWRGRADSRRCSTAISEFGFCFFVFYADAAAAKARRTKQLKWCRGRKASPAVLLCCSSWKLDPSQSPSEQKCHFFDVSIKEVSVKEAECFSVCALTPSSRRGNAGSLGADSTGGDGSKKKEDRASTGGPLTITAAPNGDRERSQTQASTNLFKTSKL